ncbi:MAG: LysR family transcriptional regulator [Oscillospiraceae bacterium]|nr:LysR family transcriptional regulator [Oscillospiraceae bacterium]
MDIKQLTYFITVAEEGSFLRAAKRLNVSQPTLSIAIKNLEAEIGAPLFFAFGRKRELTDEGNSLLCDARDLMTVYQRTLDDVKHVNRSSKGNIRIGMPPLIGACFFGRLFPSFRKEYPNINLSIIEEGAIRINELIADGTLDMAISLKSERTADFERHHFTTQRNVVLLNYAHPLADRQSLTVEELKEEQFAFFNEDFVLHQRFLDTCREAGFSPKFALLTSQWDFIMEMVAQNQCISILPKPIYENSRHTDVVAIPLTDEMKHWDLEIIWNKNRYFSKACETLYEHISQNLPQDDRS